MVYIMKLYLVFPLQVLLKEMQLEKLRGKKEGKHVKYYNDGKILSKAYFKQNNLHGNYLEFFQNGNTLTKKNTLMVELKEKS